MTKETDLKMSVSLLNIDLHSGERVTQISELHLQVGMCR